MYIKWITYTQIDTMAKVWPIVAVWLCYSTKYCMTTSPEMTRWWTPSFTIHKGRTSMLWAVWRRTSLGAVDSSKRPGRRSWDTWGFFSQIEPKGLQTGTCQKSCLLCANALSPLLSAAWIKYHRETLKWNVFRDSGVQMTPLKRNACFTQGLSNLCNLLPRAIFAAYSLADFKAGYNTFTDVIRTPASILSQIKGRHRMEVSIWRKGKISGTRTICFHLSGQHVAQGELIPSTQVTGINMKRLIYQVEASF